VLPVFATYDITLNGKPAVPHVQAAVVDGRVFLPVRALGRALGVLIEYDPTTHTVTVQRGTRRSALGETETIRGHVYAPLRAVAHAFAITASYVASTHTIALTRRDDTLATGPTPASAETSTPPPVSTAPPTVYAPYPVETAQLAPAAALTPEPGTRDSPLRAYVDRVSPGMQQFDVVVVGEPGIIGQVAVDGVNRRFPLLVEGADLYVAHIVVPPGVVQPFAHVAMRLAFPDGTTHTMLLPYTVPLMTATPGPSPSPSPSHLRHPNGQPTAASASPKSKVPS
jgi:hypothetical protein